MTGEHDIVCTIIAEAVDTGVRVALVNVELAVGAGEASEAVAVESQREMVQVNFFHTLSPILTWIICFAWQELTVYAWI